MREIKFRAWDSLNKVMKLYNLRELADGDRFNYDTEFEAIQSGFDNWIWMQYTGLKDKNGKEIWEGDVCKWPSGISREIVWDSRNACFSSKDVRLMAEIGSIAILGHHLEFIGNIYENPELLSNSK